MTIQTNASLDITSVCVSTCVCMGDIGHAALCFSVCSTIRAEVIRPSSSSHRQDGHIRARRGPDDVYIVHSHHDGGSLNQKSKESQDSHKYFPVCLWLQYLCECLPALLTYSGALPGFEGCVCVCTVKQEALLRSERRTLS